MAGLHLTNALSSTVSRSFYQLAGQTAPVWLRMAESGRLPDSVLRAAIRRLCGQRLAEEGRFDIERAAVRFRQALAQWQESPVAIHTDAANEQHYELPAAFFRTVLGPRLKYSGCYFAENETLAQAETRSLDCYAERAQLADGQTVLELGCGWGSFSLYMAARYPAMQITAVSNSHSQRAFIEQQAQQQGLTNLQVITCDINQLDLPVSQYDRVVSVEMFEHVRNHRQLFACIARWLKPDGLLWCHVFAHRTLHYAFETGGPFDWMSRYFFTGGVMPAVDTFLHLQQDLVVTDQWNWSGTHYEKTANAWLQNMDRHREQLLPLFKQVYGEQALIWWQRWRLFFMACAELFGYADGQEWLIAHYLFQPRPSSNRQDS